jgi:uncharacterized damage-inducible protein DinB
VIDADYCRLMARYNRWMNERLYASVAAMTDEARRQDRGAFFGSIHRTLSHIVWGDRTWLARFGDGSYSAPGYGVDAYDDFATLARDRDATDTQILTWAGQLSDAWLQATLEYRRTADDRKVRVPRWIAAVHLFNHATHHRGQVTTLMKQAGIDPGVTDLPWMPGVMHVE